MLKAVSNALVSMLVPPLCAVCREPELSGEPLCPPCRAGLVPVPDPRCGRCGAPAPSAAASCLECRSRELAFDRAWSAFAYEGAGRRVVGALKSRSALAVAGFMAGDIHRRAPPELLAGALVPVPPHRQRLRRQGFDHADEIARALGRLAQLPVRRCLSRVPGDRPQAGLARPERLENTGGAIVAERSSPGEVVLVDDVYTTGATLHACAAALGAAGAGRVVAVTFARALLRAGRAGPAPADWQKPVGRVAW